MNDSPLFPRPSLPPIAIHTVTQSTHHSKMIPFEQTCFLPIHEHDSKAAHPMAQEDTDAPINQKQSSQLFSTIYSFIIIHLIIYHSGRIVYRQNFSSHHHSRIASTNCCTSIEYFLITHSSSHERYMKNACEAAGAGLLVAMPPEPHGKMNCFMTYHRAE